MWVCGIDHPWYTAQDSVVPTAGWRRGQLATLTARQHPPIRRCANRPPTNRPYLKRPRTFRRPPNPKIPDSPPAFTGQRWGVARSNHTLYNPYILWNTNTTT